MQTRFLEPVLLIFGLILPAWLLYRLLKGGRQKRNGKNVNLKNELVLILFIIYVSIVLAATIAPASISGFNNPPEPGLNIIPVINTCRQFISTLADPDNINTDFALENIIGNIILFLPLGIFLPYLFPKFDSIKKVAAICFLCSLSIELTQLILRQFGTYRTVDIDDVILNTTGGILGWLIFVKLIARYLFKGKHSANNTSFTPGPTIE
jgi:glycopeptide antibiotics resistance protein